MLSLLFRYRKAQLNGCFSLQFQSFFELLHLGFKHYDSMWFIDPQNFNWILINKLSGIRYDLHWLFLFCTLYSIVSSCKLSCFLSVQLIFQWWWILSLVFGIITKTQCSFDFSDPKLDRHILQVTCNLQCKCCLNFFLNLLHILPWSKPTT